MKDALRSTGTIAVVAAVAAVVHLLTSIDWPWAIAAGAAAALLLRPLLRRRTSAQR